MQQAQTVYYSDKKYLPDGTHHTIALYPFWGNSDQNPEDPDFGRFDDFCQNGAGFMTVKNLEQECDVFLLPFEYQFNEPHISIAKQMVIEAEQNNKKLIIFYHSDNSTPISICNTLIFRTFLFKSSKAYNEHPLPGWSIDFKDSRLPLSNWLDRKTIPEISYCGHVDFSNLPIRDKLKRLVKPIIPAELERGRVLRGKVVQELLNDNRIKCNFIIREGFRGLGINRITARQEYVKNMISSPYVLTIRSAGKFSYRLYEVLSCGRIPDFVDTDSCLPFEEFNEWKKCIVWIDRTESLNKNLIVFSKNITEQEFHSTQQNLRRMYEEWICTTGFFKNIYRYFSN